MKAVSGLADVELGQIIRPHWKVLIGPAAKAVLLLAVATILLVVMGFSKPVPPLLVGLAVLAALAYWVVYPVLDWRATKYVVTRARLTRRWGVFTQERKDYAMSRLIDTQFEQTLLDHFFGTGTLILEFPGKKGEIRMEAIPKARSWDALLNEAMMPDKDKDKEQARRPAQGKAA
jgi:uncharacterized membrane protein YdbT with pleckstrin-like domain